MQNTLRLMYLVPFLLLSLYILYADINNYQYYRDWKSASNYAKFNSLRGSELFQSIFPYLKFNEYFLSEYGQILTNSKNFEKAIDIFVQVSKIKFDPNIFTSLGYCYRINRDFNKSEYCLLLASFQAPNKFYPKYQLVQTYKQMGKVDMAKQLAMEIIKMPVKVHSRAVDEIKYEMSKMLSRELKKLTYNPSEAVRYANSYCDEFAKSDEDMNYFIRYKSVNCNNFVSQVLLAGLSQEDDMENIYKSKDKFSDQSGTWKWYYDNMWDAAGEWVFADSLFMYAQYNKGEGLEFEYIGSGKPMNFINHNLLSPADVAFMDWTSDGRMDHSMVITSLDNNNRALLAGHTKYHCNYPLDSVRFKYPEASFYFFRPLGFYK